MRRSFVPLIGVVIQIATAALPPPLLQIVREPLKPGSEAAFNAIEEERARISAALGCPHPYLGAESLTGPKEVWWFNGYRSATEQQQVYDAYAKNGPLMEALQRTAKPKAELTLQPIEVVASYRADASVGHPWLLGRGRYLVIAIARDSRRLPGTVFEGADGQRISVSSAATRQEADAAKAAGGSDANIFIVRPSWSFPANEWIAADPEFWRSGSKLF
jgi:hypothetical protein